MTKITNHKQPQFRAKRASAAMVMLLLFSVQTTLANPLGPTVANGQASFATGGNTLTVTNTPNTIINWQGFSIGANEATSFIQQSATSAVLNRVISNNPSSILGALQSNGRVFLVNPSGIVFGQGALVDVAGLVATSLNLSDADFLAGRYNFTAVPGAQSISNAGSLAAQSGGHIYLIAPDVENTGIITAPNGEILLAAGHSVELVNSIEPNLRVNITAPAGDATNVGQLIAESGSLGLFGTVVRNSGTASADSATTQGGKIVFKASQRAEITGLVSANSTATPPNLPLSGEASSPLPDKGGPGRVGGTIQVLGNEVGIMDGATISANGTQDGGTILIGGDYQGNNSDVSNAQVTYVAPTANISANGGIQLPSPAGGGGAGGERGVGNGGKVIVWADDTTRYYGSILARGGANSGNGGFVETSGKGMLDFRGMVDTSAPMGLTGMLLLDPTDITISSSISASSMAYLAGTYSDISSTPSNLNAADLETQLGSSNVIVSTASGQTGSGNITLLDPVSWASANSLTLSANGNIAISAPLTGTSGSLILNAPAGTVTSTNGTISVDKLLVTSLGNVSITGLNQINTIAANVANGIFDFENAAAGGLTIGSVNGTDGVTATGAIGIQQNMAGGITVNQNVVSGAGNVTLGVTSGTGGITTGAIVSGANTHVYTSSGNITVNAGMTAATGAATLDAGAGGISGTGQINANTIALQSSGGTGNIGTSPGALFKTSSIGGAGNANISIGFNSVGPGAVYLGHVGDATLQQVFTTGAGTPVYIYSSGNLTATSINAGTMALCLSAGMGGKLLTVPNAATLSGANIELIADRMDLQSSAFSINTSSGVLWLHPNSTGWSVDLGSTSNATANTLELSSAELDTLAGSGTLRIGASANIFLSGPVAPTGFSTGTLSLWSDGTVTQATTADIITANKLVIRAGGNVALDTAPNMVGTLAGIINGTGAEYFHFKSNSSLSIDTVDGLAGISIANFLNYTAGSSSGVITLEATGNITQTATGGLGGAAVWASSSGGLVDLTAKTGGNATGILAGSAYSGFSYKSSNTIALMDVDGHSGITSTMGGNIVLDAPAFANSLATPFSTLGRWLVYANSPADVTKGALSSSFRHYNGTYASYAPGSVTESGNGFIYASVPGALSVDTTLVSGEPFHIYGATPTAQFGYAIGNSTTADNEDLLLTAGTPVFTPALSSTTPAGGYTVSYLSGLTNPAGYTFTPGIGLPYTVDPATLTLITASLTGTASKTYDGTDKAILTPGNFLLSGFVNTDSAIVTKTTGTYASPNAGSGILVSTTLVATDFSPTGSTNLANYTLPTDASGHIGSITPAPLTVAANNASKVYDAIPYSGGNGVSYAGLVNGETFAVLGGTLTYSGTSQGAVNAGSYFITPSGLTSNNYTIGYVDGLLTINPAALSLISVTANDASKIYGTTLTFTGSEFTPVGLLGSDTISGVTLTSPGAVDTANAGIYAITPSNAEFSSGNASNYTISYVDGQLTVNPALLTVTADALSKTADSADPLLTYTTTGLKFADTEATILSGALARLAGEAEGAYPINQGTLTLFSANYVISYIPADFSILAAPATQQIVDSLVNTTVIIASKVSFNQPTPPEPKQALVNNSAARQDAPPKPSELMQTPADDQVATDADKKKKDDRVADAVQDGAPANEPATAAAPLPVCK